jgi:hypothetical protein
MTRGISVALSDWACLIGNGAAKFGQSAHMAGYTAEPEGVGFEFKTGNILQDWKVG